MPGDVTLPTSAATSSRKGHLQTTTNALDGKGELNSDKSVYTFTHVSGETSTFVNKDQTATRNEYLFEMPEFLRELALRHLNNPKDLPIVHLLFDISVTTIPLTLAAWVLNFSTLVVSIMVGMNYMFYFTRFVLGMHYAEHRPLFKRDGPASWINHLWGHIHCGFFGFVPGGYKLHHVIMHHIENNQGKDISATMYYQRDNMFHFLFYWMRHLFAIWIELGFYLFRTGRFRQTLVVYFEAMAWYFILYALYCVRPRVTWVLLICPHIITSFFLMFGNWCQHILVNPKDPFRNTQITYNCVNTPDNQLSCNDGYHVVHHENGRLHWTEMPAKFMDNIERYAREDCINFHTTGIFFIGIYCMVGTSFDNWGYKRLCKYYLHLPGVPRKSDEELTAMFKERLTPCPWDMVRPPKYSDGSAKYYKKNG